MIEEAFDGKVDSGLIKEIWPEYWKHKDILATQIGTNIGQANNVLNVILSSEEKVCLEKAFFGQEGWYKRINGDGMVRIKLAAMSLELTNNIFTFASEKEKEILQQIVQYTEKDQLLMLSCYVKQKLVSYLTLKKYLQKVKGTNTDTITLYRGINVPYNGESYLFAGMESWTSSLDVAYRFARTGGYIIEKDYKISQVFAGKRSTFKNRPYNLYRHNGFFVRREHEIIVENRELEYDCSEGKHIKLAVDRDFF